VSVWRSGRPWLCGPPTAQLAAAAAAAAARLGCALCSGGRRQRHARACVRGTVAVLPTGQAHACHRNPVTLDSGLRARIDPACHGTQPTRTSHARYLCCSECNCWPQPACAGQPPARAPPQASRLHPTPEKRMALTHAQHTHTLCPSAHTHTHTRAQLPPAPPLPSSWRPAATRLLRPARGRHVAATAAAAAAACCCGGRPARRRRLVAQRGPLGGRGRGPARRTALERGHKLAAAAAAAAAAAWLGGRTALWRCCCGRRRPAAISAAAPALLACSTGGTRAAPQRAIAVREREPRPVLRAPQAADTACVLHACE
jgi:hypothetical protein